MTDQATARRPSPRPRPAGAPSRPGEAPRLHVVPQPADTLQPEPCNDENTPLAHVSAGQDLAGGATSPPVAVPAAGWRAYLAAARRYWTPPAVFTERPPSLANLAAYAKQAPWTHQQAGPIRTAGIAYYRFAGYPYTVCSRYTEWFAQRPMRMVCLLGGIKLLALTGPGDWAVHTLVYPAAHLAGRIFL